MLARVAEIVAQAGMLLGVLGFAVAVVPLWNARAKARGGAWEIEAMMLTIGPVISLFVAFYPKDAETVGQGGTVVRALSWGVYVLVALALFRGLRSRPPGAPRSILIAAAAFYFALVLSGIGGVSPEMPEAYWATPLIVMAVLFNDTLSPGWLASVARFNLRIIVAVGFALIVLAPEIAFNTQESRQLLGVSRLQGMTGHPNTLAIIASVGLILELMHRGRLRLVFVAGMLAAVLLAQSTTGTFAILFAVLALRTRITRVARILSVVGVLGVAGLAVFNSDVNAALVDDLSPTSIIAALNGRTEIWDAAVQGALLNPVLGYGPGLLNEDYRAQFLPNFDAAAQAHNQFFQSLGGGGAVGVVSLFALVIILAIAAVRARVVDNGVSLALLILFVARCVSETPLRPVGASLGTFTLIVVVGLVAYARSSLWLLERQSALPLRIESPQVGVRC